jgi:hypothetical protein
MTSSSTAPQKQFPRWGIGVSFQGIGVGQQAISEQVRRQRRRIRLARLTFAVHGGRRISSGANGIDIDHDQLNA